jgi:DNA repair exonuclease SbcCD ATPase subunit
MIDKIDKLKLKLDLLFKKINNLENENKRLLKKTNTLSQLNIDLDVKAKEIEDDKKNLKLKSALVGEGNDKQFLKNKIDYMIKEIDDCINDITIN